MKKILLAAETLSDFVKLSPLYDALKHRPDIYHSIIVHTAQHNNKKAFEALFEQLRLPMPDLKLEIESGTHGLQTGKALTELEGVLFDYKPDMLFVFGENNSTLAAALAAAKQQIPVAHIDAGLRSNNLSTPEEINRIVTDRITTLHFTMSEDANVNLLREGHSEDSIHFVGNIRSDALLKLLPQTDNLSVLADFGIEFDKYILVIMQQPGRMNDIAQFREVILILNQLASIAPVVLTTHPDAGESQIKLKISNEIGNLSENPNLRIIEPFDYLEYLKFEKNAAVVVTDSGEVQEETTYLGVPCLTANLSTDRPATISDGTNILVGLDPKRVAAFAQHCLDENLPEKRRPLFWDGGAAERIAQALDEFFGIHSAAGALRGDKENMRQPRGDATPVQIGIRRSD